MMVRTWKFVFICAPIWVMFLTARAEDTAPLTQSSPLIENLAAELAPRLAQARYMEVSPKPVVVPGWEGFPTMQCTYSVHDKALNTEKTAAVILLDPDARRLARWMVNACIAVKGSATTNDLKKLADFIIWQSGGQFPVRGIVYEDILPANGINEIYCFRDGVTVKIDGVDHRSEKQPTAAQTEKSLTAVLKEVTWVGRYARIQSTTREQYKAAGGREDVEGTNWLEVSRKLYQKAWNSETNELMTAWVKANL
jgi:hypothetical protein